jgi:hypothetical protein
LNITVNCYQCCNKSNTDVQVANYSNGGVNHIFKQKWFCLKTRTKSLKIKEVNQENPENHFNLGVTLQSMRN